MLQVFGVKGRRNERTKGSAEEGCLLFSFILFVLIWLGGGRIAFMYAEGKNPLQRKK
jgi:hypothetical protein